MRQTTSEEIDLLENIFPLIIPKYHEAHDIMAALLDFDHDREVRLVDLGCGFGGLTRRLLELFPAGVVFGVDADELILERLHQRLSDFSGRLVTLQRDLNEPAWSAELEQPVAVLSSFALDYLSAERREALVHEAHSLLEPGGRWISCEFYRSPDARINRAFHDLEIRFIRNALERGDVTPEQIDQLAVSTRLRQEHHMITVEQMLQWLRNAGFVRVDSPWRFLNLAMVSGIKE